MKHLIIPVFLFHLLYSNSVISQTDSLQRQINKQVWLPFISAFNNLNTDSFMYVHSKMMSRVVQDKNLIYDYDTYLQETERHNVKAAYSGRRRTIELRFTQHIANTDKAFETGYYKTTYLEPDGKIQHYYGKFHVLLQKENGSWKILMDADASGKTDEHIFLEAEPMELK